MNSNYKQLQNVNKLRSSTEHLSTMAFHEMAASEGNVVEEIEAAKREEVLLKEITTLRSQIAEQKKAIETAKEAQQVTMEDFIKHDAGIHQATLVKFVTSLRRTVHGYMVNVQDFKINVLDLKNIPIAPKVCKLCSKPRIQPTCNGDHADETVDGLQDCLNKLHELTDVAKGQLTTATKHLRIEQDKVNRIRDEAHRCFLEIISGTKHSYTIEYANPVISFHIQPHPMNTHTDQQLKKKKLKTMQAPETEETSTANDDPAAAASTSASDNGALSVTDT